MRLAVQRLVTSNRDWKAPRPVTWVAVAALLPFLGASELSAETLRQALTSAYQTNPALDAQRAKSRATDEDVARAEAGYRPVIEGSAEAGWLTTTSKPNSVSNGSTELWGYQITVRQSVFNGFRTTNDVKASEASAKEGQENLRQAESKILLDAVTAYMDVVRDTEILRIREHDVAVLAKDVNAAETRRGAKEVTKTDVSQARARHARAMSATDVARANLKISRANYERIVGHAPSNVAFPVSKVKNLPRSLEQALRAAEQQSPAVNAALRREEAARYTVDRVSGELLPDVTLEANYGHREDPSSIFSEQETASVTGRVTVPLYEGGETRARIRAAKHTHVSRLQEIQQARTEAQAGVTSAWSKLQAAKAQLQADHMQVEANQQALQGVREEERVGQRTLLDVLNAELEYLNAKIQLVATRHDVVTANYEVLSSMGQLSADELGLGSEIYDASEHLQEVKSNWFGLSIAHADGRVEVLDPADYTAKPDGSNADSTTGTE